MSNQNHYHTLLVVLLSLNIGVSIADEQPVNEAFPDSVPLSFEVPDAAPTPQCADRDDAFIQDRNTHTLRRVTESDIAAAEERADQKYADVTPGPLRVGMIRMPDSGPLHLDNNTSIELQLDDGRRVRTLAVRSPDAFGLRLHVTQFDVGSGQALIYSGDDAGRVVRGPFTGKGPNHNGEFWTASLPGDTVYIEVTDVDDPRLTITDVIHFDKDVFGGMESLGGPPLLPCHEDVNCHSVSAIAKNATGQMNFSDGIDNFVCTGTLLNDLDGETIMPWFITARHCLNSQAEVDTLEVVWFWQTPACDDEANLPNWWTLPRTVGGTHIRQYGENDMEFMLLTNDLPGGLGLAGWTEATSAGTYGIHHPKGSWKRWVDVSDVTIGCGSFDPFDYDSYDQDDGLTQKGSSGSGVFNSSGQLGGQLWGVCSVTTDPDDLNCGNIGNFWAVYGEFDTSYDDAGIAYWLGLGGTMYVNGNYDGLIQIGAQAFPFNEIADALDAAWPGLRIKIAANTYPENLTFDMPMTLMALNGTVTIGGP